MALQEGQGIDAMWAIQLLKFKTRYNVSNNRY
jgi:hypothetical protein